MRVILNIHIIDAYAFKSDESLELKIKLPARCQDFDQGGPVPTHFQLHRVTSYWGNSGSNLPRDAQNKHKHSIDIADNPLPSALALNLTLMVW